MTDELPWVAGFRAFESEVQSFDDFARELRAWGVELRANGDLHVRDDVDRAGVWELRPDDALLGPAQCPLVGPRLGAIAFDLYNWPCDRDDRHELFCGLMKEGRDVIAHRDTRRRWPAITLRPTALGRLTKYGLDDGAELVTRELAAYANAMCSAVEAAARTVGHEVRGGWASTHHNSLRAWVQLPTGEVLEEEALWQHAVNDVEASLWLFDFAILEEIEALFSSSYADDP